MSASFSSSTTRWRSFVPARAFDHPASASVEDGLVEIAVGGRRAMKTRLTAETARELAAHLVLCAERVKHGPSITRIEIVQGRPTL